MLQRVEELASEGRTYPAENIAAHLQAARGGAPLPAVVSSGAAAAMEVDVIDLTAAMEVNVIDLT